eukprot:gene1271-1601_t
MVSSFGNNRLQKKYFSDFSFYFNNPELSDVIIQVTEHGYNPNEHQQQQQQSNSKLALSDTIESFYAHKFVLSARSPVFMKMLSSAMRESSSPIIYSHFPKQTFQSILHYMYSGKIEINPSTVLDILASADYYNLEDLKEFCGWYSLRTCMEGDTEMDICRVLHSAEQYHLDKIKNLCFDYITQHSMDILLSSPNWHLLTEESLISILEQDNLRVPEVEIFDSLVRWAQKQYTILRDLGVIQEGQREEFLRKKLARPLKSIRFASMYPYQLSSHIELSGLVDREILYEAYRYCCARVLPSRPTASQLRQGVSELKFQKLGDSNGVLHHLGTLEDTEEYESPVARKIVKVTSSSMSIGYPHPFAGRIPTNMYTDKEENAHFTVDISSKYVLCPTYYSMRYGGDSQGSIYAAPKNWQLLGSLDQQEWTVLREHVNDLSIKDGYSIAGWEVKSVHSYRYFRIQMTGPNQRDGTELCACCFEIYGRLVKLEDDEESQQLCIQLFDSEGTQCDGTIVEIGKEQTKVLVDSIILNEDKPIDQQQYPIDIATSLPKASRSDWMIEKLSEIGIRNLYLIETDHSKSSAASNINLNKLERLERKIIEASKQSR